MVDIDSDIKAEKIEELKEEHLPEKEVVITSIDISDDDENDFVELETVEEISAPKQYTKKQEERSYLDFPSKEEFASKSETLGALFKLYFPYIDFLKEKIELSKKENLSNTEKNPEPSNAEIEQTSNMMLHSVLPKEHETVIAEAEVARAKAEAEAAKAKAEAEIAKARAEIEIAKAKAEAEVARAKEIAKAEIEQELREEERRTYTDRRQKEAKRDTDGFINEPSYKGVDRRSGKDRRDEEKKQHIKLIRKDKRRFIFRSLIVYSFIFALIISASFILFAPEYLKIQEFLKNVDMAAIKKQIEDKHIENFNLSAYLNHKIENAELYMKEISGASAGLDGINLKNGVKDMAALREVFSNLRDVKQTSPEERSEAKKSLSNLKSLILETLQKNPDELNDVINSAASYDTVLRTVLNPIKDKNVAAAAMLIALNEFRDNIYSGNSYESDIKLIQKLAGDDPELNKALNNLTPYAKNGLMSRDVLTKEFQSLAQDIVLAKVRGEDANVKERALKRFEELTEHAKNSNLTENSEEAVVARAQVYLNNGDIEGAMTELKKLKGPSAQSTLGWMGQASNLVTAEQSSNNVVEKLVKNIAGSSNVSPSTLLRMVMPVGGTTGYRAFHVTSPY